MKVTRTDIRLQIEIAEQTEQNSKWKNESYEAGVIAALRWATGKTNMPPMKELSLDEIDEIAHLNKVSQL